MGEGCVSGAEADVMSLSEQKCLENHCAATIS